MTSTRGITQLSTCMTQFTLEKSLTTLQSQLETTQSELDNILPKLQYVTLLCLSRRAPNESFFTGDSLLSKLTNTLRDDPTVTVKRHIHLLHTYNDIKDVALGLMTLLAESRGERLVDVQKGFGIAEGD